MITLPDGRALKQAQWGCCGVMLLTSSCVACLFADELLLDAPQFQSLYYFVIDIGRVLSEVLCRFRRVQDAETEGC